MTSSHKPEIRRIQKSSILKKDLKKLPRPVQQAAWEIAQILAQDVFDPRLSIRKMEGYQKVWRITFRKDYRLFYTFDEETVYILRVGHRKDIYRRDIDALLGEKR